MKITFLTHSVDHIGGTIRATLNTASALTDLGHEVEIVNVFKYRETPQFTPDPRVAQRSLIDKTRHWHTATVSGIGDRVRMRMKSKVYPEGDTRAEEFSRLTDKRVEDFLRECDSDVIVGTRPGLSVYVARYAPPQAATVAQEHLFYDHHKPRLRNAMSEEFHRLDALVTVSDADADNYRRHMPHLASKIWFIPNSIQPTPLPPSNVDTKVIVAAGRFQRSKRFDTLLRVFAKVRRRHPDWSLRIYGGGKRVEELREVITSLDLGDSVSLMGRATPLDAEWAKGSIAVSTSKYESFGLTLVEAMNCGLPVVSTACNYGPPEIIDDEVDGLLTPVQDENAIVDAVCRLIEDVPLRQRMSAAAIEKARHYFPSDIGARYDELFRRLATHKDRTPPRGARIPVGAAVGGAGIGPSPVPVKAPIGDDTVNCRTNSFDDMVLTASRGFSGRYTLRSGDHTVVDVPHDGDTISLDAPFLRRLPETRWLLFRDGEPVEAGRIDSRALLRLPRQLPGSVVVPYTSRGQFALHVWRRESYAELNAVYWQDGHLHLAGQMLGPVWTGTEVSVVGEPRGAQPQAGCHWTAKLEKSGQFSAAIDVDDLVTSSSRGKEIWELWLADDSGERASVRIARFFDDVAKRKRTQTFAHKIVASQSFQHVKPFYNANNELSIMVKDVNREAR